MEHSLYELEGKITAKEALPVSFQHVLAMLIGNATPAILIAQFAKLDSTNVQNLVSAAMLTAAVATFIQVKGFKSFGSKLPLVMGLNFAFVPIIMGIISSYGVETISFSVMVSAFVLMFFSKGIIKLKDYFPPLVTGTTVMTMGISLYPVACDYMAGGSSNADFGSLSNWFIAIFTLANVLFFTHRNKGFLKVNGMLIGILFGYLLSIVMNKVDFSQIANASYFSIPHLLPLGFKVNFKAAFTLVIMYIVTSVETMGDVASLCIGGLDRNSDIKEIKSAISGNALSSLLTSIFASLPTATFSQNVGVVTSTKVVNLKTVEYASYIILITSFLPKFSAILTSIPYPVLGGATLSVFAIITVNGIKLISREKFSQRNMTILGISLALGVGISTNPNTVSKFPEFFKLFFVSSPVIMSTMCAFLLNLILPRGK